MPRLTPVSWQEFEKFLLSLGCTFKHQRGSHRVYILKGLKRPIIVPAYGDVPIFIIRNNLRLLGKSVEQYLEIKKKI